MSTAATTEQSSGSKQVSALVLLSEEDARAPPLHALFSSRPRLVPPHRRHHAPQAGRVSAVGCCYERSYGQYLSRLIADAHLKRGELNA